MAFGKRLKRLRGEVKHLFKQPGAASSPATSVASLSNAQTTSADINPIPTSSAVGFRSTVNTLDIPSGALPASHSGVSPSQVENEAGQTRSDEMVSSAQVTSPSGNPVSNSTDNNESGSVDAPGAMTGPTLSQLAFDDSSPQAINHTWTLDENGWVRDPQQRLLLWLPVDLRHRLLRPHNPLLISTEGSVELDFEGAHIGESWEECYVPA